MSPHAYPEQTRHVARACAELGLTFSDLDDGGGYLWAVSDGTHELIGGAGAICAYPLNAAAAVQIARDKAHANTVLARAGVAVIPSRLFFITDDRIALRGPGREITDALAYLATVAGPVFCKPNSGSGGDFAEIVGGEAALRDYIARASRRHEAILIQPVIAGDEYRVFCLDSEAVFCTRKAALTLVGDGVGSVAQLLEAENGKLAGMGVSPTPVEPLEAPDRVPAKGEQATIAGRRNLAAGGAAAVSSEVPEALGQVAIKAAEAAGLRVAGVDLFDVSTARDLSDLVVIEINGNPALTSLTLAGREDVAGEIWRNVLSRCFAERRGAPRAAPK